jgi:hypothetical protein
MCLPTCLHWPFCPGAFIALLALLAAVVTFREEPSKREKALWIIGFSLLMIGEVWMMSKDRDRNDTQQADARKEQLREFSTITEVLSAAIAGQQSMVRSNQELAHLVLPLSQRDTLKRNALRLSTDILQALLVSEIPVSSTSASGLYSRRVEAASQLSRSGYPGKIKEVCDKLTAYGLNCTEPKSDSPIVRFQTQAEDLANLALKL